MNSKKEKKTIVGLVVSIIALLMFTVTMTFAYFTASSSATSSTMTFGTLAVAPNGFNAAKTHAHEIVPGCEIQLAGNIELKERANNAIDGNITKESNIDAFVRLKVEITATASDNTTELDSSGLLSALVTSFNAQNWLPATGSNDGYLYYAGKFVPNDTTEDDNIIDTFNLSSIRFTIDAASFGNAWQGATFVIDITVEAIQAEHLGITLTGTAQALVNAIAGAVDSSNVSVWAAVGGGSPPVETISELAQASVPYLSFYDSEGDEIDPTEDPNASDNNAQEMNSLNEINANSSNLMGNTVIDVSVAIKNKANLPSSYEIEIPAYVKIDNGVFVACLSTENGTIYHVTSIGEDAFWQCSLLTSITIPDSVTRIDDGAFYGCSIGTVTIPSSVTYIGSAAFECDKLRIVNFNAINCADPDSSDSPIFGHTDYDDETELVFNIGEQVKRIPKGFAHNHEEPQVYITEVNFIGDNPEVETIGDYAFEDCCNANFSIVIPASVTSIGYEAFSSCRNITVTFAPGSQLVTIGGHAFYGCENLTSITIPDSVTSIGYQAFDYCDKLKNVTIGNSVTSIGVGAFRACNIESITIPSSVTSIGADAFEYCSLTSITFVDGTGWKRYSYSEYDYDYDEGTLTLTGNGTGIDLTSPAQNATYLGGTYSSSWFIKPISQP